MQPCRAWSPDGRLIAVALAKPHPGSAQLLILDTALEPVHMAYVRGVAITWGPSSQFLAVLQREMYVHTELRQLALLGPLAEDTPREAHSAVLVQKIGVSSCVKLVEFSQNGAFLALADDLLQIAWPDWPHALEVHQQHALHAAWVPSVPGMPERLILYARQPKGMFQLCLCMAPAGALVPCHMLGPPMAILPQCLPDFLPCVAVHPSGNFVALASIHQFWVVCCVATGQICQWGQAASCALSNLHWSRWGEILWVCWSNGNLSAVSFGPPDLDLSACRRCLARVKSLVS